MVGEVMSFLSRLETFYWGYVGFVLVLAAGLYFSWTSRFYQFRILAHPLKTLREVRRSSQGAAAGVNPFRVYWASVGGMVGIGNVVGVITAVRIGGPGALFWVWVASFSGMLIKYAEIYLGMKFRIPGPQGTYRGGAMVYLAHAFTSPVLSRLLPGAFCLFLAIYGVEFYQFKVMVDVGTKLCGLDQVWVIGLLLGLCLYGGFGGVSRLANICAWLMPPFIIIYLLACLAVVVVHASSLGDIVSNVFTSAFTGHAAHGGFLGSTMIMAAQLGTARAVYSGDLGIGYDSIIQSQSKAQDPAVQGCLSIFGVATDALICSLSILVVLVTGAWYGTVDVCDAVGYGLAGVIPGGHFVVQALIFVAGYTTIIAYLTVGEVAVRELLPSFGRPLYVLYASVTLVFFAFLRQDDALTVMSCVQGLIMLLNLVGIFRLRSHIRFDGAP